MSAYAALRDEGNRSCGRRVDELAGEEPELQSVRVEAWMSVTWCCSSLGLLGKTEAATRIIDEIAAPYPRAADLQGPRAEAWWFVAEARAAIPEYRAQTRLAAKRVDDIAAKLPHDDRIRRARALVWTIVAEAASDFQEIEVAVLLVDKIIQESAENRSLVRLRARAWHLLAWARANVVSQRMFVRDAAAVVDDVCSKLISPGDVDVGLLRLRASAWEAVASVRRMSPQYGDFTDALNVIRAISDILPGDAEIERILRSSLQSPR